MASTTHKFLLIFIHGFKGSDKTFMDLPDRLAHNMLSINVNSVPEVYPSYETCGDLNKAVEIFCRWLEKKVQEHEKNGETVWVCLLGHSMGGILAADAILRFKNLPGKKPKILGLVAYDTPFYGLNKNAFNDAYTRTVDYTEKMGNAASFLSSGAMLAHSFWSNKTTTKDANSSTRSVTVEAEAATANAKSTKNYGKWAMGVAAVTAVGALTYMHKETLTKSMGKGMEWVNSHMEFVGVLVKDRELKERVEKFKDPHLIFHCFYVYIPTKKRDDPPRTFIQLPAPQMRGYFSPYECTVDNEIEAHMSMFDPEKNHNYHVLVTRTVNFLNKMAASVES